MTTFGVRVAINGTEIDCDDIAEIKTSEGGGSFYREADQSTASFKYRTNAHGATFVRTVTIAVEGPYNGTAPAWWHDNGDGTFYHIIFHGTVTGFETNVDPAHVEWVQFAAMSEMQGIFERKARTAAANDSYMRDLTSDIETAHSLTIGNNGTIPTFGDGFPDVDRPAQGPSTNGEWLRMVMAGTGMSIIAEWEGTLTAPELCWRTDRAWVGGQNYRNVYAGRPWEYEYRSVGINWRDFVAKVEVTGEAGNSLSHHGWVRYPNLYNRGPRPPTRIIDVSNGTRYYGTATLSNSFMRDNLGDQTISINSWIDTAAHCEDAAEFLLSHVGEPHLMMNSVAFWPDQLTKSADADPDFTFQDPEDFGMDHANVLVGDYMRSRTAGGNGFDDTDGGAGVNPWGTWPDTVPVNSDVYDLLNYLWQVEIENDSNTSGAVDAYNVRRVAREWTPSGGWHIDVGLEADDTVTITNTANGTD